MAERSGRNQLTTRKKLLFTAVVLLLTGLLAEGVLRLTDPATVAFVSASRKLHRYTDWHRVDLRPSQHAELRIGRYDGGDLFRFSVTVNALGFRDPTGVPELDGRRVVHCIGDSFTMGWGVEDDETYPARLQKLLGASTVVLNLGVDGYGLLAAMEKSRRVGERLPPDEIIYLYYLNDPADDDVTVRVRDRSALGHLPSRALDKLRRHSYLINVPFAIRWARALRPQRAGAEYVIPRPAPPGEVLAAATDVTADAFRDLQLSCADEGVELTLVTIDKSPASEAMLLLAEELGVSTIRWIAGSDLRIPGDGHLNPVGNRLLAERIHRLLVERTPKHSRPTAHH